MLDFQDKYGFQVSTDGEAITLRNHVGQAVGAYHPMHGDTVLGVHSPQTVVRIREALNNAKEFLHA